MEHPVFLTETFLETLADGKVAIVDNVLGGSVVDHVLEEAHSLLMRRRFHQAGMGQTTQHHQDINYRGDQICWVDQQNMGRGIRTVCATFEHIRRFLNEHAFLGLKDFELQLAWYPGNGERYGKHRDAFVGSKRRVITAIYYLNTTWSPKAGGELWAETTTGTQHIAPLADRLVVFRSDEVEHEVRPSYAPRWALTGWFRIQP